MKSRRKGRRTRKCSHITASQPGFGVGGIFLCSLPQRCSVSPSWHGHLGSSTHHKPLLISTQKIKPLQGPSLYQLCCCPLGVSSSPVIFSKLCTSRAFGLREITAEWHAGGDGEVVGGLACSPRSGGVLMVLCTAARPNTQPSHASVPPAEGITPCKAIGLFADTERVVPVHG